MPFRDGPSYRGGGEAGATSAEYAILASLIAVVVLVAVQILGQNVIPLFEAVNRGF
jgi:Flp pilus assembly pilin Flp